MNYDLAYTLRMALKYGMPEVTDVQMMYDGVDLTKNRKPFITIEYFQGSTEELSAGRRSYYDTYDFQVGVFARNISERHRLESKVREILREPKGHPLFVYDDETGAFEESEVLVPFKDNGFTPMTNDDSSSITDSHRGYFDVGIEYY